MRDQLDFLKKSAESGKIPHAILLAGKNSAEIKKTAVEFAEFINCPLQDLFAVEPGESGEIGIAQIRELIWKLSLKSSNKFKVAIINKAHLMNQESQNCLLKILEEPKGNAVLMLISEYPDILLPTITSRIQKIRFFFKPEDIKDCKKIISDFLKIIKSDFYLRFKYAKDLFEEDETNMAEIFNSWLSYLREILIKKIIGDGLEENNLFKNYSPGKISKMISQIQNANFLLSTTNINSKLALENLLVNI